MKTIKIFLCLLFVSFYANSSFAIDLSTRPDIQEYIQTISQKYHFDSAQLTTWFNQIELLKPTIQKVKKPGKPTPFYVYRDLIVTPARIRAGTAYWQKHKKTLALAEKRYGVPAKIIIGILGIETTYGKDTGHYSAFQGLATLAFEHPQRRDYFTTELTQYLLLCREHNWNPLTIRSSFDGGLGLPQFMPSSYREYAVSANSHKKPDLLTNDQDAILSIANYLHAKGWQPKKPIAIRAKVIDKHAAATVQSNGTPSFTLTELQQHYGLIPTQKVPKNSKVGVLSLQYPHETKLWLSFRNFSVIKAYNNSTNYAMTIYTLGNVVSAAMKKGT